MINLLNIRSIGAITHFAKNLIFKVFQLPKTNNYDKPILVKIRRDIILVERLKTKMLESNDILVLEGFILNLSSKKAIILN